MRFLDKPILDKPGVTAIYLSKLQLISRFVKLFIRGRIREVPL